MEKRGEWGQKNGEERGMGAKNMQERVEVGKKLSNLSC
jgi:hypothetical protein